MLHRLMSRPIFAVAHGFMRENENGGQFHECRKPNRWARIITENEEGGAIGTELGKRHSIDDRGHGILANPEMEVLSSIAFGLEFTGALEGQGGSVRRPEICRAAEEPGDVLGEHIQTFPEASRPDTPFASAGKTGR